MYARLLLLAVNLIVLVALIISIYGSTLMRATAIDWEMQIQQTAQAR
jgi:hypothetical protein